jgi:hypothetical protein
MNRFPSIQALRVFLRPRGLLALLTLSVAGCGVVEPNPYADLQRDLDHARARWARAAPDAYQMEYRRICYCIREVVQPVEITVRRGAVLSRVYVESGRPVPEDLAELFPSVPQLFEGIQEAIRDRAAEIRVAYDPALGHPSEVYIDWRLEIADEEVGHRVLRLVRLP